MGAEISSPFASESAPGPSSMTDEEFRARSIGDGCGHAQRVRARVQVQLQGGDRACDSKAASTSSDASAGHVLGRVRAPRARKTAHIPPAGALELADVVMLEVWDVVDKARKLPVSESLTLAHPNLAETESRRHTFPLDATMVDVYKGCHAAVFLIDPSKKWAYEYALRQLDTRPEHVPACVLVFQGLPGVEARESGRRRWRLDCEHLFGHRRFRPFVVETSLLNCYGLQALIVPAICSCA